MIFWGFDLRAVKSSVFCSTVSEFRATVYIYIYKLVLICFDFSIDLREVSLVYFYGLIRRISLLVQSICIKGMP